MSKRKKHGFLYGIWNLFLISICVLVIVGLYDYFISSNRLYKKRYPIMYDEIISKYCLDYDVDKYLVHSIIRTESFFKEDAISNKGAIGLMQIMPDTASWVASELKLENFSKEDLFDCEKNIMIGVWYLDYLLNRFEGNVDTAIAAYNAGPTNVSKWLSQKELSSDGNNLIDIPFSETKKYREKVNYAYDMYLNLYSKDLENI